jgi:hypothetical protein
MEAAKVAFGHLGSAGGTACRYGFKLGLNSK